MKHPLFALAGVAAMAALASDPATRSGDIALDGFENYTTGQSVTTESDSWTGSTDAVVTEYGNGEAPTGIAFPTPFTDAGDQYLAIDTGSDEVTCSAESSAATVYIDTLAQFSVLKAGEAAPEASDAKLLLWLQEDIDNGVATTNLHVRGGYYDSVTPESDRDYKLNKACEPGIWYRVTIEAYNNILTEYAAARLVGEGDDPIAVSGFVIKIDGQEVAAEESVYAPGKLEQLCPDQTGTDPGKDDGLSQGMYDLFSSNKLIPAIGEATATTVSAVAFKGSGAIDDFVVSANDPASFILTWPTELTSVSYVLGSDATVYPPLSSGSISISAPEGTQVSLTGSIGDYSKTVTTNVTAGGSLSLPDLGIVYFFPQTNTAGQDGTADHPYEVADVAGLMALHAAVSDGYDADICFVQTANIDMSSAGPWAGIGVYGDAALIHANARPFTGTYDGQGYKISNITFTDRDYAGVFNRVDGGTIKNLTVENIDYVGTGSKYCVSIVGYALNGATLENLVSAGTFGSQEKPGKHNMAGIVIRVAGGTNTVNGTQVLNCTNNATIYGCYTKLAGICAISQEKHAAANNPKMVFSGCANNGELVLNRSEGGITGLAGIVGYSDVNTVMTDCSSTGTITQQGTGYNTDCTGALIGMTYGHTITDGGNNSAPADMKMIGNWAGATEVGFQYATVESGIATTVLPPLAVGNTYLLEGNVAAAETAVATLASGDTISFDTTLGYTFAGNVAAEAPLVAIPSTSGTLITYSTGYFPRTATADQDGSPEHPFEIADLDDLEALQAAVANDTATYQGLSYVQVADITMTNAWPGIGVKGGKDIVSQAAYDNGAFTGTYDGGNYTISNFQMENGTDYGALFNSVYQATIKNLKMSWGSSTLCDNSSSSGGDTGASFVGVAKESTLQNLTALAGTVTTVSASKDFGGIVGYLMAGSTVDSCTNELNVASLKGGRKCGGIAIITQGGTGTAVVRNCKNSGISAGGAQDGGIIGYVGVATLIDGCENTAAVQLFKFQSGSVTASGVNKGNATVRSSDASISGLRFATVDGDVATFVADNALALNGSYKVMATGATATFNFTAPGTISFDTNLVQAVTFAITAAEGLTLTEATTNGVVTYTAAGAGDDDYVVTINGSDVVIAPSAEDLAAVQAAVIAGGGTLDVTDVAAVNAALAAEIGSTGIPSWQALFLGLPPTEAGLESFKIASISFNEDGKIVMTLPSSVDPKTGRGVNIALNLMGSNDLSSWTFIEAATGTTFAPVTPALGETKKFYKVVAVFSATDAE